MFQGPKGYIEQICEVHLQYGNSTSKWPFYTFFLVNSTLKYILFSLILIPIYLQQLMMHKPLIFDYLIKQNSKLQISKSEEL